MCNKIRFPKISNRVPLRKHVHQRQLVVGLLVEEVLDGLAGYEPEDANDVACIQNYERPEQDFNDVGDREHSPNEVLAVDAVAPTLIELELNEAVLGEYKLNHLHDGFVINQPQPILQSHHFYQIE